jgi:hypothetical protein
MLNKHHAFAVETFSLTTILLSLHNVYLGSISVLIGLAEFQRIKPFLNWVQQFRTESVVNKNSL